MAQIAIGVVIHDGLTAIPCSSMDNQGRNESLTIFFKTSKSDYETLNFSLQTLHFKEFEISPLQKLELGFSDSQPPRPTIQLKEIEMSLLQTFVLGF